MGRTFLRAPHFVFAFLFGVCCLSQAADLTTREGKIYRNYNVTGIEVDALRVSHSGGVERIPFENLPDAIQKQFRFDVEKMAAARKAKADREQVAAVAAVEQARQAQLAAIEARQANERRAAEAQRLEEQARVDALRRQKVEEAGNNMGKAFIGLCILCVYFLPALAGRRKRNAGAIFAMNLLLGWTFLGWVLTLVWALTKDPPEIVVQTYSPNLILGESRHGATAKTVSGRVIESADVLQIPRKSKQIRSAGEPPVS